jgi:hypothetical protein
VKACVLSSLSPGGQGFSPHYVPMAERAWPLRLPLQVQRQRCSHIPTEWHQCPDANRQGSQALMPCPPPRKTAAVFATCEQTEWLARSLTLPFGRDSQWGVKCFNTLYFPFWSHWLENVCLCWAQKKEVRPTAKQGSCCAWNACLEAMPRLRNGREAAFHGK